MLNTNYFVIQNHTMNSIKNTICFDDILALIVVIVSVAKMTSSIEYEWIRYIGIALLIVVIIRSSLPSPYSKD